MLSLILNISSGILHKQSIIRYIYDKHYCIVWNEQPQA